MAVCEVRGCTREAALTLETVCDPVHLCYHCASWLTAVIDEPLAVQALLTSDTLDRTSAA